MSRSTQFRKPQSNAVLETMTLEQKERLAGWLLEENLGYTAARERLREEFGVATSRAALCRYFQRWLAPRLEAVHAGENGVAELVEAWRGVDARGWEDAAIARGRYLAFDAITRREPDLQTAERSLAIVNQVERRRIEQEKLALQERRIALLERAGEPSANGVVGARNVLSTEVGARNVEGANGAAEGERVEGDFPSIFHLVQAGSGGFRGEKIPAESSTGGEMETGAGKASGPAANAA